MATNIVIADDHPLMLRGLSDFLTSKGFNIVGIAEDGNTAYHLIIKLKPNIAILDIRMPYKTGLEIAEDCKKNNVKTKIILITFDKEEELYQKAKEFNVYGYILKEFAIEEIEICIENVLKGKPYFSEDLKDFLETNHPSDDTIQSLTKTERKVLSLIAENKTSQEIAKELSVAVKTIHKHRSHIIAKLNLENKPSSLSVWANLNRELL
ncbi:MAG: response regulator transcription factor [Flavobacteriales bacterium]|nr:response regulator transcription factor [Flavobacteriia bacterium]NCP04952.1 response regulator transcription factor [Flavobacteriales bacterium]PIV93467.1 MAG: DNA-binding response regulator [Flavobacteriaceae bacterium CG17_big_fil_post_rev_8_21_14_2_50_33_15]PIY09487.1 MAG: DNA-binding response regulator [Flavobacteriaceae bacterium CG_4_10_14_3_um_filter_33_47]PJB16861.1 MAG: DNA-binding response regulator [Flavobacteriaceae bacterium CG_4_9_14_3_um_filter_33_16]